MTWVRDPYGIARAYVMAKTGDLDAIDAEGCIGYVKMAPNLLGAICLHDFDGITVYLSLAISPQCRISRKDIARLLTLAFDEIGARRIAARVRSTNKASLHVVKVFGFQHEGTMRQSHISGDDEHLFSLLKHEARLSR